MKKYMSGEKILSVLDAKLGRNDYAGAETHLLSCLEAAEATGDTRARFLVQNELMGLYRKLGREGEALRFVKMTLELIDGEGLDGQLGAATAYLNCGTVYKAFSRPEESLTLFLRAREIYERELDGGDSRLAGLYNNMALTLVDLRRFDEARELYGKALGIAGESLDAAITYLNLASAAEAEHGLADADEVIQKYLGLAKKILENCETRDGYYAFVCEKCSSVFLYYGHFAYSATLDARAKEIYTHERA